VTFFSLQVGNLHASFVESAHINFETTEIKQFRHRSRVKHPNKKVKNAAHKIANISFLR
jgi:hypothetical protein